MLRNNEMILQGEALNRLKELHDSSIDTVITDPPYGYSFMGKDWDKAVPSVEIWQECLRVLKPGAFMCVMSAPRSDVQNAMISRLMEAGFRLDFTPIYWTYASGFPKAGNIGKLVDKRLGAEREVVGEKTYGENSKPRTGGNHIHGGVGREPDGREGNPLTAATSPQAKQLDGSYAGFQPKPAVEVIIVAMKPLSEKTYVDQALTNGHGVSWLDDGRIPTDTPIAAHKMTPGGHKHTTGIFNETYQPGDAGQYVQSQGRFPANLLVSDDVLNDGVHRHAAGNKGGIVKGKVDKNLYGWETDKGYARSIPNDSGSYSRYFDLDKWASTLPFLITPKASKSEKNKGLDGFTEKLGGSTDGNSGRSGQRTAGDGVTPIQPVFAKNHHPTVKPLKLMSYLITLFSRPGDTVLDPFLGSGTTVVAAKQLNRKGIGIEREDEYVKIAIARLDYVEKQQLNMSTMQKQVSLL